MDVLVVDDERLALDDALRMVADTAPQARVQGFASPQEALAWAREHPVDVALLDIEMPGMGGIELARRLSEVQPRTRVIFLTSYEHYALDAFSVHATGYLLKPVDEQDLSRELAFACPAFQGGNAPERPDAELRVVTFGGFEVYAGDIPLAFKRAKAKELLALLVDRRGQGITMRDACAFLWPDEPFTNAKRSYYQTVTSALRQALDDVGAADVLLKRWNSLAVDPARIDCDLYRLLDGDPSARSSYRHNYLPQYAWAECTVSTIEHAAKA